VTYVNGVVTNGTALTNTPLIFAVSIVARPQMDYSLTVM
jgi:hypothetical protein